MRSLGVALVTLAGAAIVAASAGGARSGSAAIKVPLPPPNTAQFSLLRVKSAVPFKVSVTNAKQLGSPALNTQVIVTWRSKGKGTYDVMVVIHRFTAVGGRRLATASGADFVDVLIQAAQSPSLVQIVNMVEPCTDLLDLGLLDDSFSKKGWTGPGNTVPAFDTTPEEQLDGAGAAKCPGAEKPDPGSK